MRTLLVSIIILLTTLSSFGQEPKPKSETQDKVVEVETPSLEKALASHPLPVPELSLQRALKFAGAYLRKQGAAGSYLHLISAEFTLVGDEKNPAPSWHLRWRKKGSTNFLGYDAELYVFMNGRVWDPPVM